ncbi:MULTISPECIES: hypothetical protein [Xanthomonas]|uniref:hypothetical protein n=1 Tax=Xanthomonas TaxID=338 RepID=UPI0002C3F0EE|nr:hypothetical protein [Xanthomonas citri]AGI10585.1 hypothetical protein XCAW_b00065 [Xanthomonas citri subsp. citri Aw12879]AJZ42243.1 hypothetical protein J165_00077 [Xanthomonas citri pv. citri]AJZ46859.1 hypothetical protein J166_00078 [Xanthomonas citri pv. citri]AJZ51478.1 hypothetical protein J167_00077 [Xanthomonas citri pv. citri]AJZ64273.1 hypothetical protein J168_00077 [Xanthomonas citri pv. citri]
MTTENVTRRSTRRFVALMVLSAIALMTGGLLWRSGTALAAGNADQLAEQQRIAARIGRTLDVCEVKP